MGLKKIAKFSEIGAKNVVQHCFWNEKKLSKTVLDHKIEKRWSNLTIKNTSFAQNRQKTVFKNVSRQHFVIWVNFFFQTIKFRLNKMTLCNNLSMYYFEVLIVFVHHHFPSLYRVSQPHFRRESPIFQEIKFFLEKFSKNECVLNGLEWQYKP